MSDEAQIGSIVSAFLFGVALTCIILWLVIGGVRESWRADSVKRGFAEYNQKTGAWQWKLTAEETQP